MASRSAATLPADVLSGRSGAGATVSTHRRPAGPGTPSGSLGRPDVAAMPAASATLIIAGTVARPARPTLRAIRSTAADSSPPIGASRTFRAPWGTGTARGAVGVPSGRSQRAVVGAGQ
ncbi:hypothetical protein ABZ297_00845 [Nonomuraea sp. NPDC005983]|uniref:hypothetical protein n=1 Tax=Nonomuraea sp. NPDC005983 TaxID=3155595 RepID=UPI0033A9951E